MQHPQVALEFITKYKFLTFVGLWPCPVEKNAQMAAEELLEALENAERERAALPGEN